MEHYTAKNELFSVDIPKGWDKKESGFPYEYKGINIIGVKLSGPYNPDAAKVKISLLYYEYGDFFEDYRHYIYMQQNTMTRMDLDKKTVFSKTMVNDKNAIAFEIQTFELIVQYPFDMPTMEEGVKYEFVPPSKKVAMIEKFIIIPAKRGFFVLHYDTPEDMFDDCGEVFTQIVNSLRFKNLEPWQEKGK